MSPSQAAAQREANRRPVFYAYLNLWPFVSVMVALLFLFLSDTAPFVHSHPVDLPSGFHVTAQPRALAEDAMEIYVTRDGRVFFGDMRVLPEYLPREIREAIEGGAEQKVYLAVDARAKYGEAAVVVNEISKAGIREICFLAYKREG